MNNNGATLSVTLLKDGEEHVSYYLKHDFSKRLPYRVYGKKEPTGKVETFMMADTSLETGVLSIAQFVSNALNKGMAIKDEDAYNSRIDALFDAKIDKLNKYHALIKKLVSGASLNELL